MQVLDGSDGATPLPFSPAPFTEPTARRGREGAGARGPRVDRELVPG